MEGGRTTVTVLGSLTMVGLEMTLSPLKEVLLVSERIAVLPVLSESFFFEQWNETIIERAKQLVER